MGSGGRCRGSIVARGDQRLGDTVGGGGSVNPAGEITTKTIESVAEALEPGDVVIDGGNTYYHDDLRHAAALREKWYPSPTSARAAASGPAARLLPDDWRRTRSSRASSRSSARSRRGVDAAPRTPGRTGELSMAEYRLLPRRPERCQGTSGRWSTTGSSTPSRPRTRKGSTFIRNVDAGKRTRDADAEPRRSSTWSTTATRSTRPRSPEVAARQRRRLVAARPHRAGVARVADARGVRRARLRLRRGQVDVDRRDRGGSPAIVRRRRLYSRFASRDLDHFANRAPSPCASSSAPRREDREGTETRTSPTRTRRARGAEAAGQAPAPSRRGRSRPPSRAS